MSAQFDEKATEEFWMKRSAVLPQSRDPIHIMNFGQLEFILGARWQHSQDQAELAKAREEIEKERTLKEISNDMFRGLENKMRPIIKERDALREKLERAVEALKKIGQDDWRYHEIAQEALNAIGDT